MVDPIMVVSIVISFVGVGYFFFVALPNKIKRDEKEALIIHDIVTGKINTKKQLKERMKS